MPFKLELIGILLPPFYWHPNLFVHLLFRIEVIKAKLAIRTENLSCPKEMDLKSNFLDSFKCTFYNSFTFLYFSNEFTLYIVPKKMRPALQNLRLSGAHVIILILERVKT